MCATPACTCAAAASSAWVKVPINLLVQVEGTKLAGTQALDAFDFVRTVAVARILMPKSYVRLSAGRENMNEQTQALCYFAGANSIFYGEKLLTTPNPDADRDMALFEKLGLRPLHPHPTPLPVREREAAA